MFLDLPGVRLVVVLSGLWFRLAAGGPFLYGLWAGAAGGRIVVTITWVSVSVAVAVAVSVFVAVGVAVSVAVVIARGVV
ncbi:hypothetical protein HEK616_73220 [Streptomyces nigrescens]|uniref:Uncharacterized protein n=1 Tax=Streptomyces nigrescens TaxID=1920 RepID=A0ABN6R9S4_STRNI|nr:hypothetical protein [Streptomyces nigrescens]BDM73835.1 hypothetical protein HEK616_73220 [Streptomyces nigrescens]